MKSAEGLMRLKYIQVYQIAIKFRMQISVALKIDGFLKLDHNIFHHILKSFFCSFLK